MSRRFFMMSEIIRWDTIETFQTACYAFECIKVLKQANLSIADINNLQDFLIENGVSISRLTTKPVSEEGWAEKLYNELSIIYGLYCDDWDLNDSSRSADVLHDYQTRNIP